MVIEIKINCPKNFSLKKAYEIIEKSRKLATSYNVNFESSIKEMVKPSTINEIEIIVCEEVTRYLQESVTNIDLYKNTRKPTSSLPRQIMSTYLMKTMKPAMIAERYGLKSRANIMYGEKTTIDNASVDRSFRNMICNIERRAKIKII